MCQGAATDYKAALYANWEGRIQHLEKIRYLLLGAQIAVLTYVLNAIMPVSGPSQWTSDGLLLMHVVASIVALLVARLVENVSRGANTAAIELMLLEYRMGVVREGLGYYARRAGRRRHGFRLLPIAGDLVSLTFIGASWLYQARLSPYHPSAQPLFLLLFVIALALALMSYRRSEAMFERKDRLDRWCQQHQEALVTGEASELLCQQKIMSPGE